MAESGPRTPPRSCASRSTIAKLDKYAFGTRTAEFLVCGRCGIVPVVTSLIDGRLHAVVNVNAFENVDPSLLQRAPTNFEGEDVQSRSRAAHEWITDVQYTDRLGSSGRRAAVERKHGEEEAVSCGWVAARSSGTGAIARRESGSSGRSSLPEWTSSRIETVGRTGHA
jgi:hypothetical protein